MIGLIAALAAAQAQAPALPEWMAGCWEQRSGERLTVECWSIPEGAVMKGESVMTVAGKVAERETIEIVHEETDDPAVPWMTYRATPSGAQPTAFHWVPSSAPGLTFLNASHDYPQRIRYWREGNFLMAEIALADGSKARRWRYSARGR